MLVLAEQNRVFGYAAAASLALHALLLLLSIRLPLFREPAPEPPEAPLVARLAESLPPAAPTAPAVQQPEPPKPQPPPKPKRKPKPRPIAKAAPLSREPVEEPAAEEETNDAVTPPAPTPAPAAPAPAPPSVSPPVAAIAPSAPPAPDPEALLAGFRRQLVAAAVRYKRYPRVALDNGWTGDVVVRMEVDARGRIASLKVKSGSGHDVLDAQALEMFRKAAAEVPVPAELRGKAFPIEVRAIYNLRDRPG